MFLFVIYYSFLFVCLCFVSFVFISSFILCLRRLMHWFELSDKMVNNCLSSRFAWYSNCFVCRPISFLFLLFLELLSVVEIHVHFVKMIKKGIPDF